MAQMICISYLPWQNTPFRTQRLVTHLPDMEILFFQPAVGQPASSEGIHVLPNLTIYTLPASLFSQDLRPRTIRRGIELINQQMENNGFEEPLLWACTPVAALMLDDIPHHGLIYDCDRFWHHLPVTLESNLAYQADLILTASQGLEERLSLCNDNIAQIPWGTDVGLYSTMEQERLPIPPDFESICTRGPVFGYLGVVDHRLNLNPVISAAAAHPDWQFVFLGKFSPRNPYLEDAELLENIHFLGTRSQALLPDYLYQFDVCFDLVHSTDPEDDIIPSRIYTYLLTGKPIVALHLRLANPIFPDVIHNANSTAEFMAKCEKALMEHNHWAQQRRKRYGVAADWVGRYEKTNQLLDLNGFLAERIGD